MMVRIAIIGSLLVMLAGAVVVAVIIMGRPDSGPGPERTAAATDRSDAAPAPAAPALPSPELPRVMPLPPEPAVPERPAPVAPASRYAPPLPAPIAEPAPPAPLAVLAPPVEPAPPVPRRKPPVPMTVEPAISAPSPPPRAARPAQPDTPVRQPAAPVARTEPVPSARDRSRTGAATEQPVRTERYQPWSSPPEPVGPATPAAPPASELGSPVETAALPPEPAGRTRPVPPGDAPETPEVSRYKPWTPPPESTGPETSAPPLSPEPAGPSSLTALPPPEPRRETESTALPPREPYTPPEPTALPPREPYSPPESTALPPREPYTPPESAALPPREPYSPPESTALPPREPYSPPESTAPPAPEPARPTVTAALPPPAAEPPVPRVSVPPRQPPPAADTSGTRQVSRYKPWTPSDGGVRDVAPTPRTPGRDLLASINPTLERVPCSVLTASVEGGTVRLWGAVRNRPDLQQVKSTLMNMRDVTGVRTSVRRMSRTQCELVNLFSPYVSANRKLEQRISVRARTPEAQYEEYDNLVLDLGSPGRDGYVYVDYYALDGSVVHLIPSNALPANRMRAGSARRLGDRPANGEWIVGKPLGIEMIVALSSTTPLFTSRREEVESAELYLLDLQTSLKRAPDGPAGAVLADIVFIKTVPVR